MVWPDIFHEASNSMKTIAMTICNHHYCCSSNEVTSTKPRKNIIYWIKLFMFYVPCSWKRVADFKYIWSLKQKQMGSPSAFLSRKVKDNTSAKKVLNIKFLNNSYTTHLSRIIEKICQDFKYSKITRKFINYCNIL